MALGCDPGQTECSCTPPGLRLEVCSVDEVDQIELSGEGCSTADRRMVDGGPDATGFTVYDIQPRQTGSCSIAVYFKNAPSFFVGGVSQPLTINHGPGCCSGLYVDPLSSSTIMACTQAEAGADAEAIRDAFGS